MKVSGRTARRTNGSAGRSERLPHLGQAALSRRLAGAADEGAARGDGSPPRPAAGDAGELAGCLLDQTPLATVACDAALRIVHANDAAQRLAGDDTLRQHFDVAFPLRLEGTQAGVLASRLLEPALRGHVVAGVAVELERPDGDPLPLLLTAGPLHGAGPPVAGRGCAPAGPSDGERRIVGCVVSMTEIPALKRAEKALSTALAREQAARAAAERADHAKDEFLITLSHELRTPLTAMLGWTRLLLSTDPSHTMLSRGLEIIERNARVQARIIDDLLDVSRIISGKLRLRVRTIDLAPVVEAALDVVRPAALAKRLDLELRAEGPPCRVSGDPDRLQQITWNLLVNAVKFTPEHGRVTVRLAREGSHVELSVIDSGEGIDPTLLPHVFDRFRQGDGSSTRTHGGLGVGLALVRHLVELHGGTVHAESAGRGRGARFTVRLRAVEAAREPGPDAAAGALATERVQWMNGLEVLLVEDDEETRSLLTAMLGRWGASIAAVASVDDALAAMDRRVPHVLVSDIAMPLKDGYDLIRAVRARSPERGGLVPAIALTAFAGPAHRIQVLSEGFQLHVPKPVEPAELATAIVHLAPPIATEPA